jgi:hypothetical protein
MAGRPRKAWAGKPVNDPPSGFPLYAEGRKPRVVTSDVWAYVKHVASARLPRPKEKQALAFIDQAFEFFEAGDNPRLGSRPLLYYYSFLNLAKMALLVHRVALPPSVKHGISDPRANLRTRLRFTGQTVRAEICAADHSQVFPEFVRLLGYERPRVQDFGILMLLSQIPSIHRTYCRVTRTPPLFLPIKRFELIRDGQEIWVRLVLSRNDKDVSLTLKNVRQRQSFRRVFDQVESGTDSELWFETGVVAGPKRATDNALRDLAEIVAQVGVWPILTANGNRFYFSTLPPRDQLPSLASIYAVMFYLGSLTRYKPYDFDKIVTHKYAWLVGEFLNTQPTQFLYGLASHLDGVEVVRPYAAARHITGGI